MERTEIIRATCKVIDNRDLKNGLKDSSMFFDFKKLSKILIVLLIILNPKIQQPPSFSTFLLVNYAKNLKRVK